MRLHHSWLLGLATVGLYAEAAAAAHVITQTVDTRTASGKSSSESSHVWTLDGGKFVLAITSEAGSTRYVFNGKTLYACGKLDPKQTDALKKSLTPAGRKQLEKYASGACQVVPSNFMARFFLSPMSSVESVDVTDGLRLTMGVDDYEVQAKGGKKKVQSKDCEGFERSYTVTRKGDAGGKPTPPTSVEEKFCQANLSWRKNLWSEVAKTVLRQPKGRDLMRQLQKDKKALDGFTMEAAGTLVHGSNKSRFELKTVSVTETEVPAKTFQPPAGYAIFSPENLELLAAANAKAAEASSSKKDKEEASVVEFMQSAVFCAIAGKLGCFGN